jgi:cysteine synthase B
MIQRAEERGDIQPGDTLIEATSGNTGIALAMAAAIKGYRMVLIMPEDLSIERAQTMKAFGAELILTPKSGGMEYARDLAENMQKRARAAYWTSLPMPTTRASTTRPPARKCGSRPAAYHALCERHGHHGHHHGVSRFLKEKNPAIQSLARSRARARVSPASASGRRNTCPRSTTRAPWTSWLT